MDEILTPYIGFCLWFSCLGAIGLVIYKQSVFGVILISEYEYININHKQEAGETCFWAAVIYVVLSILSFIYIKRQSQHASNIST